MPQNPSGQSGDPASGQWTVPTIPSTVELYDLLMKDIEPELTSVMVPTLAAKYRKETPEQSAKRAERYAKAFRDYDRKLEQYIGDLNASIRKFGRQAAASMEALEHSIKIMETDVSADSASNS